MTANRQVRIEISNCGTVGRYKENGVFIYKSICENGHYNSQRVKKCQACLREKLFNQTLGEAHNKLSAKGRHDSWKNAEVRSFARNWMNFMIGIQPCQSCGYSRHTEFCHIKPLKSFDSDAKMIQINHPSNILHLCPNCHWEFDNTNDFDLGKIEPKIMTDDEIYKLMALESDVEYIVVGKFDFKKGSTKSRKDRVAFRFEYPSDEELFEMVWSMSSVSVAKKLGLSDSAIAKRCKKRKIQKPTRGYWMMDKERQARLRLVAYEVFLANRTEE